MKRRISLLLMLCLWITLPAQAQDCDTPTELSVYTPTSDNPFIRIENDRFMSGDRIYPVYGINYYPMKYPWRRFLTEADMDSIGVELEMMHNIGINTLRLFLWNQALFQCNGISTQPVEAAFTRLDDMMQLAHDYDMRLIVTLNDMPDLSQHVLYDNPDHLQEQTRIIISRYQNEPVILAWDLRNEGDIDYGSRNILEVQFPRTQVLGWLHDTSELVRSIDSHHLITAGWLNEAHSTDPYVDFLSFHHWTSADDLAQRIRGLQLASGKPILLQEVGYSTHRDLFTPETQADLLRSILQTSYEENLLGWMVWTAFDFSITDTCYPSPCQSPDNLEHYFGIWTVDYQPKPALSVIQQYTQG